MLFTPTSFIGLEDHSLKRTVDSLLHPSCFNRMNRRTKTSFSTHPLRIRCEFLSYWSWLQTNCVQVRWKSTVTAPNTLRLVANSACDNRQRTRRNMCWRHDNSRQQNYHFSSENLSVFQRSLIFSVSTQFRHSISELFDRRSKMQSSPLTWSSYFSSQTVGRSPKQTFVIRYNLRYAVVERGTDFTF